MRLICTYPDCYVFEKPTVLDSSKTQLTIVCHGNDNQQVRINGELFTPMQLSQKIRTWTQINKLRRIRLAACMSATPIHSAAVPDDFWATSFASQLSRILKDVYVRGYVREVTTTLNPDITYRFYRELGVRELGVNVAQEAVTKLFRVMRDDLTRHYHSVVFLNGNAIRQIINGGDFVSLVGDW